MQYNAKEKVFEISIRAFTDDLEKGLSEESNTKVNLSTPTPAGMRSSDPSGRPTDKNDPLLEKYVRSHFAYTNPQKQTKPINYVGHEIEADANWLYLEMPYAEPFKGGFLKQSVLIEMFDDQVNMVNIQYQGQKKTFVFRKNQPVQDVSFWLINLLV